MCLERCAVRLDSIQCFLDLLPYPTHLPIQIPVLRLYISSLCNRPWVTHFECHTHVIVSCSVLPRHHWWVSQSQRCLSLVSTCHQSRFLPEILSQLDVKHEMALNLLISRGKIIYCQLPFFKCRLHVFSSLYKLHPTKVCYHFSVNCQWFLDWFWNLYSILMCSLPVLGL